MKRVLSGPAAIYAVLSLSTGLALVVAVLAHVSMSAVLAALAVFALLVGLWVRAQASPSVRAVLARRALLGVGAGVLATLAYDGVRLGLVVLFHLRVRPLEALPVFGKLLLGAGADPRAALIAGTMYHYTNGLLFGVGYVLLFARRPWWYGIFWGLGLEIAMLLVYPRFLSLGKVLEEFTLVSCTGHVTYGAVLGGMTRRFAPQRARSAS